MNRQALKTVLEKAARTGHPSNVALAQRYRPGILHNTHDPSEIGFHQIDNGRILPPEEQFLGPDPQTRAYLQGKEASAQSVLPPFLKEAVDHTIHKISARGNSLTQALTQAAPQPRPPAQKPPRRGLGGAAHYPPTPTPRNPAEGPEPTPDKKSPKNRASSGKPPFKTASASQRALRAVLGSHMT